MNYRSTPEFDEDLKKLLKKFRTLEEDLEIAKIAAIELYHIQGIDNQSVFPIPGFSYEHVIVHKLKKFSSKSLKGRGVKSGIRVIYAFYPGDLLVDFIEMYYKSDQENEDRQRIIQYLKSAGV